MSGELRQATPHDVLIAQLHDPSTPKTEREHAAAREISALLADRARLREVVQDCVVYHTTGVGQLSHLLVWAEAALSGSPAGAFVTLAELEEIQYEELDARYGDCGPHPTKKDKEWHLKPVRVCVCCNETDKDGCLPNCWLARKIKEARG